MECIDIAKIGERIGGNEVGKPSRVVKVFSEEFRWKSHSYKPTVDIDVKELFKDLNNVQAFQITIRPDESIWLTLNTDLLQNNCRMGRYLRSMQNLIETFFIVEREHLFDDDEISGDTDNGNEDAKCDKELENEATNGEVGNGDDDGQANSSTAESLNDFEYDDLPVTFFDELYQKLRDAHAKSAYVGHQYTNEHVQNEHLRPTLTQYQMDGVKWMLNRENSQRVYPTELQSIQLRWPSNGTHRFYYNRRTIQLAIDQNDDILIPSGGILADAMGLGKTVEMLTLILLNQKMPDESSISEKTIDNDTLDQVIRCLCPGKSIKALVKCNECHMYQHRECVTQFHSDITPDTLYYCPYCWKQRTPLKVKTTFIVSPPSIKMQWYDEIAKHVAKSGFKVFVYGGLRNDATKWINPYELGSYDVILTDYVTLQSEFYFTDPNPSDRKLRHPSRYINARSPLLSVHWWRICLDEAQMVSSIISAPAKLMAKLSAMHRWAVTGTPIQKSMDDLFGLISFLNCSPYNERNKWIDVLNQFQWKMNVQPIIDVLEPIMWRTCKSKAILNQINIPEQSEVVHFIQMSDVENLYYNIEHRKCWDAFCDHAKKFDTNSRLAGLNPHLFRIILEPLRKLRQDCTVPRMGDISGKHVVQQDELLKHLFKNTENEAKSELRSITSCLNGLAAMQIIKENPVEAAKLYRSVLKWASDYNDRVAVDSLLQIHAIYNLLAIDDTIIPDEKQQLYTKLNLLETKFLHKGVSLVNTHQYELDKWQAKADQINDDFQINAYQWWIDTLYAEIDNPTQLLTKITVDIESSYGREKMERIREGFVSVRSISLLLTSWLDDIIKKHNDIKTIFVGLREYSENFKPIADVEEKMREKLTMFLDHAYSCHLFTIRSKNSTRSPRKRMKISMCKLCETKRKLDAYEAIIFNKDIVENDDTVYGGTSKGSWKASYQESILRIVQNSYHSRARDEHKDDAKNTMQYLDALKHEFKEFSQLWVELNYTVSAYDEIKMCKSRTEAVDPTQVKDVTELRSNLIISLYEVDPNIVELHAQKAQAELNLVRKLGQLKYLSHLEKNRTIEECPVCKSLPVERYVVFECGHHMCMSCYTRWVGRTAAYLNCVVCRHQQKKNKMYYVSMSNSTNITDSTSKIEKITRHVLELKKEDPNVKIVIFSQWKDILFHLQTAFTMNDISYRSNSHRFYETIREFKHPTKGVSCLLLPIHYGSKGLNLTEATHVFFVEPVLSPGDESQAIGRIHRMGQTKKTYVHRFIVKNTIEEAIHQAIANDSTGLWAGQKFTIESLMELFSSTNIVATE